MPNSLIEAKTAQDWINLVLAVCLFVIRPGQSDS